MLNINPGHNKKLMKACRILKDYSEYVSRVRRYAESMEIEDAVELAITECIQEGILENFLKRNRAEAKKVSIYEYDEEKHMRQTREEGFDEGEIAGSIRTYQEFSVPLEEIEKKIAEKFSLSEEQTKIMIKKYADKNGTEKGTESHNLLSE